MRKFIFLVLIIQIKLAAAQDSLKVKSLNEVVVSERKNSETISFLPATAGTFLYSGIKNQAINVLGLDANIAEKTGRQIFSKIPGVFVYDMDGSGNQINIAIRGLDAHRGWEFNNRVDGVIVNTDMYGYPASHYSMPMEAVQSIQMVSGTSALQYGAQFGGMINYVSKTADTTKKVSLESINSVGSFGLVSTFNSVGGKIGKLKYYVYYSVRKSTGYRENSKSVYDGEGIKLKYDFNTNFGIEAKFNHSKYLYQLPGPLTDSMFYVNPRQSTRSRNYYSPDIYVPSLVFYSKFKDNSKLTTTISAILGTRKSVMFDKPATVLDIINAQTLDYSNRQVDIDGYHSFTGEMRYLKNYWVNNVHNVLLVGIQLMHNNLHRQQMATGTTGTDYTMQVLDNFKRDMHFKTENVAFFLENKINFSTRLAITPSFRIEHGQTTFSGRIDNYDGLNIPIFIKHHFPLFGINAEFKKNEFSNFYGGVSQAYRPVIFKDIIPSSTYEIIDKNLKDANGYVAEVGYRGIKESFKWDVSAFLLRYNNRMGSLSQTDANGNFSILRTNIGNSLSKGIEAFLEYEWTVNNKFRIILFGSTAFIDAKYLNATIRVNDKNVNIKGNKVQSTPPIINRNGVTFKFAKISMSALYSYTAKSYADALNTVIPNKSGSIGLVPSYGLMDLNSTYYLSKNLILKLNVNNLFNKQYFTKRPEFYPGPGVWPSDGRSINLSLYLKI